MNVHIRGKRKHDKHQMHISTWHQPNWFERYIMQRRSHIVNYVGKGTKWFIMELGKKNPIEYREVKNKTILKMLKELHP